MDIKPRIFIASSSDNVKYAHAVHRFLNNSYAYTKLWETAVAPGEYTLPSLLQTFDDYDFGIFLFSEDDIVKIRNREYSNVRDNVLFEFGLFVGKHGQNSAFILTPQAYLSRGRLASDLFGITVSVFDSSRDENDYIDAISSECLTILAKIKRINSDDSRKKTLSDNPNFGICVHEANMFSELVQLISEANEKLVFYITCNERLIVFDLFIAILYARLNRVTIDIHYFPQIQKHTNSYSIEIFKQLGCNTKEYPIGESPSTIAFIADPENEDYGKMIVKTERFTRKNVYAYSYKGSIHFQAIKSVSNDFQKLPLLSAEYIPTIQRVSEIEIEKAFENIPLYKQNNCVVSVVDVAVTDTFPQADNLVREFKIKQIALLNKIYFKFNFDMYEATNVVLANGKKHLIVPPVLEEQNGKLLVAEGHTRLFMNKDSSKKIKCVKIVGMTMGLPSEPTKWDKIQIAPDSVFKLSTVKEEDLQRTRKIEKYLHRADWFCD